MGSNQIHGINPELIKPIRMAYRSDFTKSEACLPRIYSADVEKTVTPSLSNFCFDGKRSNLSPPKRPYFQLANCNTTGYKTLSLKIPEIHRRFQQCFTGEKVGKTSGPNPNQSFSLYMPHILGI